MATEIGPIELVWVGNKIMSKNKEKNKADFFDMLDVFDFRERDIGYK